MNVIEIAGTRAVVLDSDDGPIADAKGLVWWLGDVMGEEARALVVPVESLPESFFDLRSGLAGEVLQKASNYRIVFAVVGDVTGYTAASRAFHDLVVEAQHAKGYAFAPDMAALETRFAAMAQA
jgi:hypothetical protein